MSTYFSPPPVLSGTEKEQLRQLRRYLISLSEELNMQLSENASNTENDTETKQAALEKYSALKKGITKNGEDISKLQTAFTVLWENPAHTSSFAAQTVSVPIHDCQLVIISYKQVNTAFFMRDVIIPASLSGKAVTATDSRYDGSMISTRRAATCSFAADTVTFAAGRQNAAENNAVMIPYRIYGVKGVN